MATRRYNFGDMTVESDATSLLQSLPIALAMAAARKPAARFKPASRPPRRMA
jgi:hypothetical protein